VDALYMAAPGGRVATDEAALRQVADAVHAGQWRGWRSVVAMAGQLGLPLADVMRLYAHASGAVARARGGYLEQLEAQIAVAQRLMDEELAAAEQYKAEEDAAYKEARKARDVETGRKRGQDARMAAALAAEHRKGAMQAEKMLATLTVLRPGAADASRQVQRYCSMLEHGAFAEPMTLMARVYERLVPGVSDIAMEAVRVWEQQGDAGLEAWLDQASAAMASV
jgi:hypothetical protein